MLVLIELCFTESTLSGTFMEHIKTNWIDENQSEVPQKKTVGYLTE